MSIYMNIPKVTLHFIYVFGILWAVSNNISCNIEMCNQPKSTHTHTHTPTCACPNVMKTGDRSNDDRTNRPCSHTYVFPLLKVLLIWNVCFHWVALYSTPEPSSNLLIIKENCFWLLKYKL